MAGACLNGGLPLSSKPGYRSGSLLCNVWSQRKDPIPGGRSSLRNHLPHPMWEILLPGKTKISKIRDVKGQEDSHSLPPLSDISLSVILLPLLHFLKELLGKVERILAIYIWVWISAQRLLFPFTQGLLLDNRFPAGSGRGSPPVLPWHPRGYTHRRHPFHWDRKLPLSCWISFFIFLFWMGGHLSVPGVIPLPLSSNRWF